MDSIVFNKQPDKYEAELDNRVKKIMEMNLLERISELAYLCFLPSEIAVLCGLEEEIFLAEVAYRTSNEAKAYWVGKMRYKVKQRLIISDSALKGITDSEDKMQEFYNKQKEEEDE